MSDDGFCRQCHSYGNVHDPARHRLDGAVAPSPDRGARWVLTRSGVLSHLAAPGSAFTGCGRPFAGVRAEAPLLGNVCISCASTHRELAVALGIVR